MRAFWKDVIREINHTRGRFLSLLIITALGATSIVGIQAAAIDMRDVADALYKEHFVYDLLLKSTMGFNGDDIAAIKDAADVSAVMPAYTYDVYIDIQQQVRTVRTHSLPDQINTIQVLEGRLPQNANECVVERSLLLEGAYEIGNSLTLKLDHMDDYFSIFHEDTFTIVGVVSSPLYISSHERGNTSLGDGSLHYYLYVQPDAYELEIYTDLYVLMSGSQDLYHLSDEYDNAAQMWKRQIEPVINARVQFKVSELADIQHEINDGWDTYNEGVKELDEKVAKGQRELDDSKHALEEAKARLESGQIDLDKKIAGGQSEINSQIKTLKDGQAALDAQRAGLQDNQAQLDAARRLLAENLAQLAAIGPQGASPELDAQYDQLYKALAQLDERQAALDAGLEEIDAAQQRLDEGAEQIESARRTLENERIKAQNEIDSGWADYELGQKAYRDGVELLNREQADALIELADAKQRLLEAQDELDKAPTPEWFTFTRKDGVAFDSYYQDTLRLQKIGYVFPLVFFLVAVMVSLTTMSRMVEEHRTQIGIYKALGYRPLAIMTKYLIYALSASLIGGIFGVLLGSYLFPAVIFDAYKHLYDLPPVVTPIPGAIGLIALISSVASVVLVTLGTCASSMTSAPAQLMRPKAPPAGKRVLLERVPFIWNRLGFTGKVAARNIFRYKKRFIMTLIGVAGCSALLLTAFGLRDSLDGVSTLQYENIVQYDMRAYLKEITTESQRAELEAILPGDHLFIREESVDAQGKGGGMSASLVVPEKPEELARFISLQSTNTGARVSLAHDGILVTEKLARVMGVSIGDSFEITAGSGHAYTLQVTGVIENYVLHYIYMPPEIYASLFGMRAYPNSALAFTDDAKAIAGILLENEQVQAVINTANLLSQLGVSTDALSFVTIVLIILACALALVVLFNLTNINITERLRELATIKVLGFQDEETAMYVYRENGGVTVLGIVVGIIGGIFLHRFVLSSVEIDLLKFPFIIQPLSYVLAAALSAVFAVFVNWVMHFKLAKIDMVESLKNVE